jgi:hypothetical protein
MGTVPHISIEMGTPTFIEKGNFVLGTEFWGNFGDSPQGGQSPKF